MKKETQCIHSGGLKDQVVRGINSPVYTSSAFEYLDREDIPYPRYFNTPNQRGVVRKVCELEKAEDGILFSSGMAAISTSLLAFAGPGDHVIMLDDLYGGSHSFATNEFQRLGMSHTFTETSVSSVSAAIMPNTRLIVIESPTNPLLKVIDIRKIAEVARERNIITIFDNTFASPINQNPIALGVDIVVHSGTKYLGGHSDLCCGVAVADEKRIRRIKSLARYLGGSLNAATCYLLERSLKTLAVRVARQSENAMKIAEFLAGHNAVRKTNYPGLPDFPGHDIAAGQMSGFGGMLSFEIDESRIDADHFIRRLKLIRPAVSLGGVETTICSPVKTSHSTMSADERRRVGISDALLRLSVGIEQVEDLLTDLEEAMRPRG